MSDVEFSHAPSRLYVVSVNVIFIRFVKLCEHEQIKSLWGGECIYVFLEASILSLGWEYTYLEMTMIIRRLWLIAAVILSGIVAPPRKSLS